MNVHGRLGLALVALVAIAVTGCAPMTTAARKPASPAAPPATSTTAPAEPAPVPAVTPTGTVVDTTTPSPDAQRVLARIPEPLTPAQQALNPSPDSSRTRVTAIAPAAAYDSLQAAPVPTATPPLGTETSTVTMGETPPAGAVSPTAASAPAAAGASAGAAAPAAAGAAGAGTAAATSGASAGATGSSPATTPTSPCWRLQVGAPLESEKEKADARLEAAQSLLVAPFTIVPEKGYLKIRTRDCMTRETADALKKRAVDSGFSDAFLVDTSAKPPAAKHQRVPPSKRKQ